ncbi:DUF3656 domain-containing protein, partial [Deinococcus sp. MIMF12]
MKPLLDAADPVYTRPVTAHFRGHVGEPPALTLTDEHGHAATTTLPDPLQPARNRGMTEEGLRESLGKLGGTGYHLAGLTADLTGLGFLPVSALNALRREAADRLTALRAEAPARRITPR